MKNLKVISLSVLAFVTIASTVFVGCQKQQELVSTNPTTKTVKNTRAPKCNRDYIINMSPDMKTSWVTCPKGGSTCYRDKKGNHGCGENADPKARLANYTSSNGTINTAGYFQNENYSILFGDVNLNYDMLNQINSGTLHLYLMPWTDATEITEPDEDNSQCTSSTYVLSSASTIGEVNSSNISLIWIY